MAEYIYIYMNKIVLTMSKIKHTSMKIWNEQNIYISDRKEKNKHEGEIKDIIAWMYPSMKEYFRNQRSSTSLRSKICSLTEKKFLKPRLAKHF